METPNANQYMDPNHRIILLGNGMYAVQKRVLMFFWETEMMSETLSSAKTILKMLSDGYSRQDVGSHLESVTVLDKNNNVIQHIDQ